MIQTRIQKSVNHRLLDCLGYVPSYTCYNSPFHMPLTVLLRFWHTTVSTIPTSNSSDWKVSRSWQAWTPATPSAGTSSRLDSRPLSDFAASGWASLKNNFWFQHFVSFCIFQDDNHSNRNKRTPWFCYHVNVIWTVFSCRFNLCM